MMSRAFLYLELMLGYIPLIILWLLGVLGLPFGFALAYEGDFNGYLMIVPVLLGAFGVWGATQLSRKLIWPETAVSIYKYRAHLISGCGACAIGSIYFAGKFNAISVYVLCSVIVTTHLYHVASKKSYQVIKVHSAQ